ncbi:NAD(P)-binding protein [Pseudarthrobacter sp. J47]|uniref:NAD(P)-binding protein n=1 Tax=Pseudarthrobacter sp. J47 TaxID=3116482 RepID=UPI003CC54607
MRVAVLGAGIAGLTTAAGLARAGAGVEVFERGPRDAVPGAGISLFPNSRAAMRTLGFQEGYDQLPYGPRAGTRTVMAPAQRPGSFRRAAMGAAAGAAVPPERSARISAGMLPGCSDPLGHRRDRDGRRRSERQRGNHHGRWQSELLGPGDRGGRITEHHQGFPRAGPRAAVRRIRGLARGDGWSGGHRRHGRRRLG